jgi:hydroxyacyl-ACP dehydratase HTD2-like protein with hotdog domain
MTLPRIEHLEADDALPEREIVPDNVQLFLYGAALWNAHRIHYDAPYATGVENYPGLVVPGPLMGDWLTQCVIEWLDDSGRLVSVEYSNRRAAFAGERLTVGGSVTSVDADAGRVVIDLWVRNAEGEVVTPGTAVVVLEAE